MNQQLGKAVANVLYPAATSPDENNADVLWSVISDEEKHLCFRIAKAVLSEIRNPSKKMLGAAESQIGLLLDSLDDRISTNSGSVDLVATAFTAMIDELVDQTDGEPETRE